MNPLSKRFSLAVFAVTMTGNAFAAPSFSICGWGQSRCVQDATAKWIDALSTVDYATESVKLVPYEGIVIESDGAFQNLTVYLKGYKGVGRYPLVGTEGTHWSRAANAVYSDDLANAPHWVSTKNPADSFVEITKVNGDAISGKYKVTLYLDGDASNKPVKLEGEFTDIPKITDPPENR